MRSRGAKRQTTNIGQGRHRPKTNRCGTPYIPILMVLRRGPTLTRHSAITLWPLALSLSSSLALSLPLLLSVLLHLRCQEPTLLHLFSYYRTLLPFRTPCAHFSTVYTRRTEPYKTGTKP